MAFDHFSTPIAIGQRVGRYEIVDVLGKGGMGVVYRAHDTGLHRTVAIKTIAPALAADAEFVDRQWKEARTMARLEHPHIVHIHNIEETPQGLLIIMEYVDGVTLKEKAPLPWRAALPLFLQTLDAFGYAHRHDVVHRDVKPANIMVSRDGIVKVMDFGLAKLQQGDAAQTATQGTAGTPYYMSPEQVRGLAYVDARSDLYSLGMSFVEVLAGRLPFDAKQSEFDIMHAIVYDELEAVHDVVADLPAPLADILAKAVAHRPEDRYQRAEEMAAALRRFEVQARQEAGIPEVPVATVFLRRVPEAPARPPRPPTPAEPSKRRWPGVLAVLLLALAAAGAWAVATQPPWLAALGVGGAGGEGALARLTLDVSPPDARVLVDDAEVEPGAGRTLALPPGRHTLRLEREGYAPLDTSVALAAGEALPLRLALAALPPPVTAGGEQEAGAGEEEAPAIEPVPPATGTLRVRAQPSGAVYVGGTLRAQDAARLVALDLPPGRHTVRIEGPGGAVWQESVTVTAGQQSRILEADFTKTYRVVVTALPAADPPELIRADVYVDGRPYLHDGVEVQTPYTLDLPAGLHTIEVRADGFAPARRQLLISQNRTDDPVQLMMERQ
ncbi:MAG: serine/threonine-protein kinase [Rhodothermales bacterium]|nr:serine/threonine-protein kinase [Rhodothermales bacterium]